ncbi:hypothetical protein [Billgrantia desiderata]|uniref:hypothetical protein n=1 Tax=Billgrantia desiderata TaxID=52021 RepID=UPI00089E2C4D|nr:hypothetical protein [Halomonas desiderata]SEG45335.1 methyltransferase, FkbM family [Halomonas desiderata]
MEQHLISALHRVDGIILHLGAGKCRELDTYLETAAEQIVLVEPNPEAAQGLRQRAEADPRVKVIEAAVAGQGGTAKLHRYNVSGLATLHPLKTLPTQWPGLREVAQLQVKALDMAQLLGRVTLAEDKQHWLVIETPGEEKQVLRALREHDFPQRFAHLSLTIGSLTPQVEEARPVLLQALEETGYRLEHVVSQAGQLVYHAKGDTQWKMIQDLKASLKSAEEANQRLKNERQSLEKLQVSNGNLQQENRQLKAENEGIQQRQALLEDELRKAEVQVELIKELFLSKEDAEQLETKEREE